jgi:hypothetical protein
MDFFTYMTYATQLIYGCCTVHCLFAYSSINENLTKYLSIIHMKDDCNIAVVSNTSFKLFEKDGKTLRLESIYEM